ncbi:hypothetical protein AAC387_Pa04g2664 [Persea americana]
MGKQGPCCHCGVTSTPLWRNGPPGKPVLCNACGSRWRTKGTLANYAPLHSLGFVPVDSGESRYSCDYKSPLKKRLRVLNTRTQNEHGAEVGESVSRYGPSIKGFEDFTSNRSSSGSVISLSESCAQLGGMDGNVISGSTQTYLWDSQVPSRKRTGNKRKSPSPVEKLRRDLYDILHGQETLYLSGSSDEVLLFEKEEDPMVSVEIGLGIVFIKQPVSSAEVESEATPLALESKISCLNDAYMESLSFRVQSSAGGKYKEILDVGEGEVTMENSTNHCVLSTSSL